MVARSCVLINGQIGPPIQTQSAVFINSSVYMYIPDFSPSNDA